MNPSEVWARGRYECFICTEQITTPYIKIITLNKTDLCEANVLKEMVSRRN